MRFADLAFEFLAHTGLVLISLFMILQIVEIVGRKLTGFSILGLSEIGQLLVMSCICLTLPFVFVRDGHVAVEFVTDRMPPRLLFLLKSMIALASMIFVGVLAYYGFGQAMLQMAKGDFSPTLGIPLIWYWAPLLLGVTASAAACLVQAVRNFALAVSTKTPRNPADGRT